jgi:hypothetical protein
MDQNKSAFSGGVFEKSKDQLIASIDMEKKYGKGAGDTYLSMIAKGAKSKDIETRLSEINQLSAIADKKVGAIPEEKTNMLLEEQNAILKERLGGVK